MCCVGLGWSRFYEACFKSKVSPDSVDLLRDIEVLMTPSVHPSQLNEMDGAVVDDTEDWQRLGKVIEDVKRQYENMPSADAAADDNNRASGSRRADPVAQVNSPAVVVKRGVRAGSVGQEKRIAREFENDVRALDEFDLDQAKKKTKELIQKSDKLD